MAQAEPQQLVIAYPVPRWSPSWAVPEVPVPESILHDLSIDYLRSVLLAWISRSQRNAQIARNLGIRWVPEEPRLHPTITRHPTQAKLRISDTRFGSGFWPTEIEQRDAEIERLRAERARRSYGVER